MRRTVAFLLVLVVFLSILAFGIGYLIFPSSRATAFQAAGITETGKGVLIGFFLYSAPGDGKILVNVANSHYKEDTERSLVQARYAAETLLGATFATTDFTLDVQGADNSLAGESAGAAFALAIIANQKGLVVRDNAVISAALASDGFTLEPIGGADEKIISAIENGKTLFVISGQQELRYETELGKKITIVRVSNIREAAQLMLI